VAVLVRLERDRLWPGAAAGGLRAWALFLRDPYDRLFDSEYGCGQVMCCNDPVELRAVLETIAHALPPRDA